MGGDQGVGQWSGNPGRAGTVLRTDAQSLGHVRGASGAHARSAQRGGGPTSGEAPGGHEVGGGNGRTGNIDPALGRTQSHPALDQVPALAASVPRRKPRGIDRCGPPSRPLCPLEAIIHGHRCRPGHIVHEGGSPTKRGARLPFAWGPLRSQGPIWFRNTGISWA